MNTLIVSALLCATATLTAATVPPENGPKPAETHLEKRSIACPWGWTQFRGRCFRYVPRRMSWAKAERNCHSLGGNLASVHNVLEYHELQRLIMSASYEPKQAWIGGTDAQEESHWFWSDGSPFHYLNWCPGEPNNHSHGQHCLRMNHAAGKCWDDFQCYRKFPSVCVRKIR